MSDQQPVILWFRQDLRLADNPALDWAASTGRPLILIYILEDGASQTWSLGSASKWWLHKSLSSLSDDVAARGATLILRKGDPLRIIPEIARSTETAAVAWNRCYEPHAIQRDTTLKQTLTDEGMDVLSFNGALWAEPWTIRNNAGQPFKVFTPFWKSLRAVPMRPVIAAPSRFQSIETIPDSDDLGSWKLLPVRPNWAAGFEDAWMPGEAGADAALSRFIADKLDGYADARNLLGRDATSRLSPHLHFGEISPVQVRATVEAAVARRPGLENDAGKFLSELAWREFSISLLFHSPTLPDQNWRSQFDAFEWRTDPDAFAAWSRGMTGYPVVDAGMRELWATGFMHNRARMIVASFLIKDLLIDWRQGERWFWDTLVDADLANNASSWQWVAGSGADAAPYFRVFNPVAQGEQYDADGAYVRKWVPELANLPDAYIHQPWEADAAILRNAKVILGQTYPKRIVDHAFARERALSLFKALPKTEAGTR